MNTTEFNDSQFNILLKEIKNSKLDLEKTIVEEVGKNKQELKNTIKASEARLMLKIEDLNKRVSELEQENLSLKYQVESLHRAHRKNNVVIFGLEEVKEGVTPLFVCQELNKLLNTQIHPGDISNLYNIGRPKAKAVKVEFTSQLTKTSVLQNSKKLKGTKLSIVQDLTKTQQEVNKILRKHLAIVRNNKNKKSYIKGDKLFIDNAGYSIEDLEGGMLTLEKANSEPSTPVRNTNECAEGVFHTFHNIRREEVQSKDQVEQFAITSKALNLEKAKKEDIKYRKEEARTKREEGKNKAQTIITQSNYKTRANSQNK